MSGLVRKRISGDHGWTIVGGMRVPFDVQGRELRYRFPFHGLVDMTFPKGNAFARWLLNVAASPALGQIRITDARHDMKAVRSHRYHECQSVVLVSGLVLGNGENEQFISNRCVSGDHL